LREQRDTNLADAQQRARQVKDELGRTQHDLKALKTSLEQSKDCTEDELQALETLKSANDGASLELIQTSVLLAAKETYADLQAERDRLQALMNPVLADEVDEIGLSWDEMQAEIAGLLTCKYTVV
jgi:DNA-binding FrmR family transcriptional regulator